MTNLFFDLDGTLADPFRAFSSSMRHAFRALSLEIPGDESLRTCIGPPLRVSLPNHLGITDPKRADEILKLYREHHARECVREYEFYPDALPAIRDLKRDFRLFVVTSKPWAFARPIMAHFSDEPLFREVYGPELSGLHDDKADLIRYILEQERIAPDDATMIGDRKHDIIAAKKNKVPSVGVTWGYGSSQELEEAGADRIVGDYSELLSFLRQKRTH